MDDGFKVLLETVIEQKWLCTTATQIDKKGKRVFATLIGDQHTKDVFAILHHCGKNGEVEEGQAIVKHFEITCAIHDLGDGVRRLAVIGQMENIIEIATEFNRSKMVSMN
jgi:hypothetical protein